MRLLLGLQMDQMENEAALLAAVSPCPSVLPLMIGHGTLVMEGSLLQIEGIQDRPVLLTEQIGLQSTLLNTPPLSQCDIRALAMSLLEAITFMQVGWLGGACCKLCRNLCKQAALLEAFLMESAHSLHF